MFEQKRAQKVKIPKGLTLAEILALEDSLLSAYKRDPHSIYVMTMSQLQILSGVVEDDRITSAIDELKRFTDRRNQD